MTNNKPVNRFNSEMPCHGPVMFNENSSRVISVATYWYDSEFVVRSFQIFEFRKLKKAF